MSEIKTSGKNQTYSRKMASTNKTTDQQYCRKANEKITQVVCFKMSGWSPFETVAEINFRVSQKDLLHE